VLTVAFRLGLLGLFLFFLLFVRHRLPQSIP
jgi:hypothetical protein